MRPTASGFVARWGAGVACATLLLLARIEIGRGATESATRLLRDAVAQFRGLPSNHWRVREANLLLSELEPSG